jgi:hypothetical protein
MARLLSLLGAVGAAMAAAGCAFMNPAALPAGSAEAEVTQKLGRPTGAYALPGGGKRVEYARGPYGKDTWMLDFDANGRLAKVSQVLTEANFNAIRPGMGRDEVLAAIGRPGETSRIAWQRQTVWSYRYETPFCQWFQIGLDESGRVADSGYYPDPLCEVNADDRTPTTP